MDSICRHGDFRAGILALQNRRTSQRREQIQPLPPKKSFFTTIGIPFNETASINTVLGFVFC